MQLIQKRTRNWRAAVLPFTALGAIGLSYLDVKQREFIFRPVKRICSATSQARLNVQEHWLALPHAEAGSRAHSIYAWWVPADHDDAPAVLFLHGARWNLTWHADRIASWRRMGFSVLGIDYRGFGLSPGGVPTETGVYTDSQCAWAYLRHIAPTAARYILYGHSLGGAIAIELATKRSDVDALIVESSFTSIRDMARTRSFRWLPVGGLLTQHFDSLAKVRALDTPSLFLHGTADVVVPHDMSARLYAAAPAPKKLVLFPGSGHSNIPLQSFERYQRVVQRFIASAPVSSNRGT
jgi:uncharacterized protein